MPKTTVAPRPADVLPIWDELVAELGDPRPYTPTEIGEVTVTDESFIPPVGWTRGFDAQASDDLAALDRLEDEARAGFDELYQLPTDDQLESRTTITELPIWPS
jgi:hypothetical protein